MKIFYSLIGAALLASSSMMAQSAEETTFTYAQPDAETRAIGWGRLVSNDVAILLKDPAYVGYEVVGISVDIPIVE